MFRQATFELSVQQVTDLENRNPAFGQMIADAITYGTINLLQGYSFNDSVYGNVLVSVDSNGNLHIIGNSPVNPDVINQAPYVPPPNPQPNCQYSVLGMCLDNLVSGASLLTIAVVWYLVFKK